MLTGTHRRLVIQTLNNIQKRSTRKTTGPSELDSKIDWQTSDCSRGGLLRLLFFQQRRGRYTIIDTCKFYLWNLGAPNNIDVSIYSSPRLGVISTVSSFDNKMTTHRSPCRWHLMIHLGLKQPTYGIMVYSFRRCEHYDLVGDPKVCSWPNFLISHLCQDTPL